MKKWLLMSVVLYSCIDKNVEVRETEYQINGSRLQIYTIDGCEYFGRINSDNSDFLSHKGNCKFCKARHSFK